jgi:hypothetical protein
MSEVTVTFICPDCHNVMDYEENDGSHCTAGMCECDDLYAVVSKDAYDQLQAECGRKDKVIAELEELLSKNEGRVKKIVDAGLADLLTAKDAQLAKYKAALEREFTRMDFRPSQFIADLDTALRRETLDIDEKAEYILERLREALERAALAEGEPTPDKKDEIK